MKHLVGDVMTRDPFTLSCSATIMSAAQVMRDADVGDVIVLDHGDAVGIVTDRDIVVRGLAAGCDLSTAVGEIASRNLATVAPSDPIERAVTLMRKYAIRRLAVLENNLPVGIISIGDLALTEDPGSALADISGAPATH